MVGGLSEPDSDGGDVDGSAVHELALVVPGGHRAVPAEPVDGAFDGVAFLVDLLVEGRRAAALGRSEERRVGKEGRSRRSGDNGGRNAEESGGTADSTEARGW